MIEQKNDDEKKICPDCVGEPYLKAIILKRSVVGTCDYCGNSKLLISIDELATHIERGLTEHYQRTPTEPSSLEYRMINDRESNYDWERQGEPIIELIEYTARLPHEAAKDIQELLSEKYEEYGSDWTEEETEFSSDSFYEEGNSRRLGWINLIWNFDDLDEKLKRQNRYFNKPIQDALDKIFSNLHQVKTKTGHSVLEIAGPEQPIAGLFRARVFQNENALVEALKKPDLNLGPPPRNLARGGRMNAHGISVFYGATSIETAIAETRPPVGSKVLVGNFPITTKLILLNLSKFSEIEAVGSIFDPHFIEEKDKIVFMRHLEERFTKPVMPDDETIDYVTTQVLADYLSQIEHPQLDGIIFKSGQGADAGLNVVLFNKSSKVKRNPVFENSVIEVSTYIDSEDGPETWYSIDIDATPMEGKNPEDKKDESKLDLDINSLTIHHIKKVSYTRDSFSAYYYFKDSGNTQDWKF